jgi:hypothetical protein
MPTIGHLNFAFTGSDLACFLGNFERDNFLPLVFTREEDALDFAFRFAAIGLFYVNLPLRITQAAIPASSTDFRAVAYAVLSSSALLMVTIPLRTADTTARSGIAFETPSARPIMHLRFSFERRFTQ